MIKKEPLYETIYQELLGYIQQGIYKPGEKLPSEKELSEQYEVSRITSKKALEKLADQGLIIRMPGKGSFLSKDQELFSSFPPDTVSLESEANQKSPENLHSSPVIGIVLDELSSLYESEILSGIEEECQQLGYHILFCCSKGSREKESKAIEEMLSFGVSGIIILCTAGETYNEILLKLVVEKFPLVTIERKLRGIPVPCVGTDYEKAARELTISMIKSGCKRLCFLTKKSPSSSVKDCHAGFLQACMEHGAAFYHFMEELKPQENSLHDREQKEKNAAYDREILREFLEEHNDMDGFLVQNFQTAWMLWLLLKENRDKETYQIACFEEPELFLHVTPFTYLSRNGFQIGKTAVSLLANKLEGSVDEKNSKEDPAEEIMIPFHLIEKTEPFLSDLNFI